jgi:hypothetical protein
VKTAISSQSQLNFNQILQIVKQLPATDKIKLSKELEKDVINSKLTKLLRSFKTDELTEDMINQECKIVREKLYSKSYGKQSGS